MKWVFYLEGRHLVKLKNLACGVNRGMHVKPLMHQEHCSYILQTILLG